MRERPTDPHAHTETQCAEVEPFLCVRAKHTRNEPRQRGERWIEGQGSLKMTTTRYYTHDEIMRVERTDEIPAQRAHRR